MARDFTELAVWQKAKHLAVLVYRLTKNFPKEELYSLTDQLRRAAVSVAANIAEAHGRRTSKDITQFLLIARGSIQEVRSHLGIAVGLEYVTQVEFDQINGEYIGLAIGINKFISSIKS